MKACLTTMAGGLTLGLILATTALADQHMETEKTMGDTETTTMSKPKTMEQLPIERVIGKRIINTNSEEIGILESIVRDKGSDKLSAVISVGGFLGIGEKEVAIPLSDIRIWGNYLRVDSVDSERELEAQSIYDEQTYAQVPVDTLIDLSLMQSVATDTDMAQSKFERLDSDDSGYLIRDEARMETGLIDKWDKMDTNSDDRLDMNEFSAFEEAQSGMSMPKEERSGY